jgi:transposase
MKTTVIGMDIAKHVFQLHRVDPQTGEIARVKLKRTQVAPWFAQHPPCRVAMEACGGAHHWARTLAALGHTVTLLPPRAVRPFVQRNKTDAADAQAIWIASQQPGLRPVAVKTETQQSVLALHRLRAQLLKLRIMQTNALRGILSEFGHVLPEGHAALLKAWPRVLADAEPQLPAALVVSLREQRQRVDHLQEDIDALEQRLQQSLRDTPACRRVAEIPGVGVLTATAVVATMGSPAAFANGREFAAWTGLVPRQTGTGGRIRQQGISKRGDRYLRTLLMHAARSIVRRAEALHWPWLLALLQRRPYNVAVAAVANKLARTIWAVLAHGASYRPSAWQATT